MIDVTLDELEMKLAECWGLILHEAALKRGAKTWNTRPELTPAQLQALDVASKIAVSKALGIPWSLEGWQSWDDADIVWHGLKCDIKSDIHGNNLSVPARQNLLKFDVYIHALQLSPDSDFSRWKITGWIPAARFAVENRPIKYREDQPPMLTVPVYDLIPFECPPPLVLTRASVLP